MGVTFQTPDLLSIGSSSQLAWWSSRSRKSWPWLQAIRYHLSQQQLTDCKDEVKDFVKSAVCLISKPSQANFIKLIVSLVNTALRIYMSKVLNCTNIRGQSTVHPVDFLFYVLPIMYLYLYIEVTPSNSKQLAMKKCWHNLERSFKSTDVHREDEDRFVPIRNTKKRQLTKEKLNATKTEVMN